jgi:predicted Holliday junction resolvase-like endonuclease
MDLLGVKDDTLDFIELKKKGASLGTAERKIRRLVQERKVRYVIKDVELPDGVEVTNRDT